MSTWQKDKESDEYHYYPSNDWKLVLFRAGHEEDDCRTCYMYYRGTILKQKDVALDLEDAKEKSVDWFKDFLTTADNMESSDFLNHLDELIHAYKTNEDEYFSYIRKSFDEVKNKTKTITESYDAVCEKEVEYLLNKIKISIQNAAAQGMMCLELAYDRYNDYLGSQVNQLNPYWKPVLFQKLTDLGLTVSHTDHSLEISWKKR